MKTKRLLIGITGASGAPLAVELLRELQAVPEVECHVILSACGELTMRQEQGMSTDIAGLCTRLYRSDDYGAGPASGSFQTIGMVVIPSNMKTLASIVSGYCDPSFLRAADVTLKERRKLVLVPRECPYEHAAPPEFDCGQ